MYSIDTEGALVNIDTTNLERAIIGCLLMDGELFKPQKGNLELKDFTEPLCREIYSAMIALEWRGIPIDPVTVIHQLHLFKREFRVSEIYYIASEAPPPINFEHYVLELIEARGVEYERAHPEESNV